MERERLKHEIETFLSGYLPGNEVDEELMNLLRVSLGRVLLKTAVRGGWPSAFWSSAEWRSDLTHDHVVHIRDWLLAALASNAEWLSRKDAHGRPRKLMKFGSVEAIVAEADKAMLIEARKHGGLKLEDGEEEIWLDLDNGFTLVRLLTEKALDRESAAMQHCIGNGGYDRHLRDGTRLFLSLRDAHNKAHATIELDAGSGTILQLQGKQNALPSQKYILALRTFLVRDDIDASRVLLRHGLVLSTDGRMFGKHDIPPACEVIGSLEYQREPVALPPGLVIRGNLMITWCGQVSLPPGLVVKGDFTLAAAVPVSIPDDAVFEGSVRLSGAGIGSLPRGMDVPGLLDIASGSLPGLPENLRAGSLAVKDVRFGLVPASVRIDGSVSFKDCSFDGFEAGLEVHGDLSLEGCVVNSLPEGFRVGGTLDLTGATVRTMPLTASIAGGLVMMFAEIEELPEGWEIGGLIEAGGSKLRYMPRREHVKGDLGLADTRIKYLGSLARVDGTLNIERTPVSSLPEGLSVGSDIAATGSSLGVLPDGLVVNGRLGLASSKVETLPDGLCVAGSIDISDTAVARLPSGLSCGGYLDITGSSVRSIPPGTRIGHLMCDDNLEEFAGDAIVEKGIILPAVAQILSADDMRERIAERSSAHIQARAM